MARDRKRSKQRRARNRATQPSPGAPAPGPESPTPGSAPDFDEPVLPAVDLDEADEPVGDELPELAGARPASRAVERQSGNRVAAFLRASWAELQRVQWPDRRQVAQATAVVLGFVVIAGAFLGFADFVSQKIVDAIL